MSVAATVAIALGGALFAAAMVVDKRSRANRPASSNRGDNGSSNDSLPYIATDTSTGQPMADCSLDSGGWGSDGGDCGGGGDGGGGGD